MCCCQQCMGCLEPPEPEVIYYCSECEQDIYEYEQFIEIGYEKICMDCFEDMSEEKREALGEVLILEAHGGEW